MVGSNENSQGVVRPSILRGVMGNNRRALSTINGNIVEAPQYPCKLRKKNGVTDKYVDGEMNPIHRPVTRKYAAQVADKPQQPSLEVTKPVVETAPNGNELEGAIITDVEDYKATSDYVVPMSVQHTEAMMEEIDRMDEEIEMEEIEKALIVDIDRADKKNVLAAVEYIDDIHAYYKKIESSACAPPNYMEQQFDINERMRAILIDWLIEVHYKFELMEETLYLTVNLIDRFLAVQPVVRKELQLVGVTALFLACKYEEVSVPVVEDLILISDKAYTGIQVLEMEKLMINTLQFKLSVPTTYMFMKRFLKAAQSDKKVELLSFFMTELCLVEYETLRFPPSMLAAAAIFTAQCTLGVSKEWTKTCEKYSKYTRDQLLECSKLMVTFHQKAATGRLNAVHRKYSISKYGFVAKMFPPASFLLEEGKSRSNENRGSLSRVKINAEVHNRDLWSSKNSKFFYGCSNASSKFAKAKTITHPNRYLLIVTSGGLNQQRTGITDAVVAARILNATLVVPKLDKTSFWKDSSDFSDIFDVDWFIKHLTTDVTIIKDLPLRRGQIWTPHRMRVPRKCSDRCYINRVLPVLMKRHAVQISKFDYRLANKLDTDLQKLRCRVNYHALKFADPILKMGEKLVQRMRMSSKHYIALHLRFEPDMLAFSGCYYGGGDKERTELGKIRRRWKTLHNSNPEKARRQGRCPLTPEEVGLMLRALGYGEDVHIYVASGEVYGGEETLAPLKALFPNFYSKDTIASKEELEPFSTYSSRMAALDFIVCDESDVFVTNNNGNMAKILAGRRRYFGHKPTIRPNAKKLNRVFLNRNNMTTEEISSRVHTFQRGFMGDPKEVRPGRGEFHENPSTCICEDAEAEKKMDWDLRKSGKDNVAKKKDGDDKKKDIEAVVHDETVDYEPEMADPEDEEEDEDNPPGEVSLGNTKTEVLSNGTSTDYDSSMSEDTELDELLSD